MLTFGIRRAAFAIGAVDDPDGARKIHTDPVPTAGGVAIWIASLVPTALLLLFSERLRIGHELLRNPQYFPALLGLFVGGTLILLFGLYDDITGSRPREKLLAQVLVAVLAWIMGFRIESIDIEAVQWSGNLGLWGFPLTIFWFLGCINAINLIDGLDGLAAGLSLLALLCMTTTGALFGHNEIAFLSACVTGATFGFLFHNFHPARIFLGDSGSMFLGFCIAALALSGNTAGSSTGVALLVPVTALGLPIMDTALAMLRRWVRRMPFGAADRGHLHHRLLKLGFDHRQTVLAMWGICVLFTGAALLLAIDEDETTLMILGSILIGSLVFGRIFGGVALRHVLGRVQNDLHQHTITNEAKLAVNRLVHELDHTHNLNEVWQKVKQTLPDMGLDYARLELGGNGSAVSPDIFSWRNSELPISQDGENDFWEGFFNIEFQGKKLATLTVGRHIDERGQSREILYLVAELKKVLGRRLAVLLGMMKPAEYQKVDYWDLVP